MSPPPKRDGDGLAEVERALSVLDGRHPEAERLRREEAEAREKKRAEAAATFAAEGRADRRRRALVGVAAGLVVVAGVAIAWLARSAFARKGRLDAAVEPLRAAGFEIVATSSRASPRAVEATVSPGCSVAIATDPAAKLVVTRQAGPIEGPGPVLFCTCDSETVTVSGAVDDSGGVALARIDAAAIGGSRAFPFAPLGPRTTARTDDACVDASFDAWLEARRAPKSPSEASWLSADPRRPALVAGGLAVAATGATEPFVALELPKDSCVVALSSRADDELFVRARGGVPVTRAATGVVALCASQASIVTVHHERLGAPYAAFVGPAATVGGLLGLREVVGAAGATLGAAEVVAADRGWDAMQALVASAVPDVSHATAPDVPKAPDARVVAVSFASPGALAADAQTDVYSYCDPPLDPRTRESICVFSGPHQWSLAQAELAGGVARAKLPFWLTTFVGVSDPVALKAEVALVSLARRLRRGGFEPTILEGVTELPNGAAVLGRSNEDAVVVVATQPADPWVIPYTDGPAWSLGDAPRIIPLRPLEKITVTSVARLPAAPKGRRTLVFRRTAR